MQHTPIAPMDGSKSAWIEPEIRTLAIDETAIFPHRGADIGGNPAIDCQLS